MTRRLPWLSTTLAFLVGVAVSCDAAVAADKTKVDRATKQVEQGAKQISQGNVGQGVKETAKGMATRWSMVPSSAAKTSRSSSRRPLGAHVASPEVVPWPRLQVGRDLYRARFERASRRKPLPGRSGRLWHRLLGRSAFESGIYVTGNGAQEWGDCRRRGLMLATVRGVSAVRAHHSYP
jgi:hypothetical protein